MVVLEFESIDSTNEEAKRCINAGEIFDNTVIKADVQLSGKGRSGNKWISDSGNLFCSIVKKVDVSLSEAAKYSFLTAISVGETIKEFVNDEAEVKYKWPNDVLLNKKKVSGILLESLKDINGSVRVIIGTGVNLNSVPQDADIKAVSIFAECGVRVSVTEFFDKFLINFNNQENVWKNQGFSCIRSAWLNDAYNLGKEITVNLPDKTFKGIFEGISQNGELEVIVDDKKLLITSGEVFF
ncbi:MAG: biotin--[acetyl-CoA-carboxylase] ligase [Rickettsiales bacterium]|nr:biotin--[acetyl-CoA-carboxylase] ligase [Pseudomonadota bacterium]MDA0966676.1 biotin--[acetyl-CoA-carboxylase] ligase [Pseudomonadota bacterium]MDG4543704.1 biotin--[acetyl-CoA-carboxylase] ligase [Rickettsiales bacterium]MDG4545851.1 biotin--[acetyl-CoA-carboxylase] ligase [Rickettsiales bacterium]MDG4547375.1 biotin--[acetyl-CoA-carboxylase] ligase [Rickettsiales bacterium]